MNGFSTLMFIFAISVFLVGLYMFTGHKIDMLTWRVPYQNLNSDDWKKIGKYTMIVSMFILIIGIIVLIFNIQ